MRRKSVYLKMILLMVALLLMVTVSACSSGVSQKEYDEAMAQLDALRQQIDSVETDSEQTQDDAKGKEDTEDTQGSDDSETPAKTPGTTPDTEDMPKPSGKFDEETVLSQLDVTEYKFSSRWYDYAF